MSKWLKSTTQKSWVAACNNKQIVIPPNETPDNRWLELGDDEFAEVSTLPVIASLIKAGGIMVLDQEPAELKNSIPALQITNGQLQAELDTAKARILQLEDQLKNTAGVDIEAIKAEAIKPFQEQLSVKETELKELDEKASKLIEEKDTEIADLKKKLRKAKGGEE